MNNEQKIIKEFIPKPFNVLLIGILLLFPFFISLDFLLKDIILNDLIRKLIYFLVLFVWILIWQTRYLRPPRAGKNKVGIIIAIKAEGDKQYTMIKDDFVNKLNELARGCNLLSSIEFMALNNHHSLKAINLFNNYCEQEDNRKKKEREHQFVQKSKIVKKFSKFKKQTKSYFYVWGNIKKREENTYFLSLDAMVTHAPVNLKTSDTVKKEFLKIFPRRISFLKKFELRGLETSANHIFLVVRFITGIAALISANPFIALKLHRDLEEELKKISSFPKYLSYMANRCKTLISEELRQIAIFEYRINHDKNKAIQIINDSLVVDPNNYDALISGSYIEFDKGNGDTKKALNWIRKAKNTPRSKKEFAWLYNEAFLLMNLEKFNDAFLKYSRLLRLTRDDEERILNDVLKFIKEFLKENPQKIQFLFVIGYLYYKKKYNVSESLGFFEEFIEKSKNQKKYEFLTTRASSYKSEIKEKIGY